MLKIEDHHVSHAGYPRFRVVVSDPGSGTRGYHYWAANVEELQESLNHYFRHGPRADDHVNDRIDHCPLCRLCREERTKEENKAKRK